MYVSFRTCVSIYNVVMSLYSLGYENAVMAATSIARF